MTTRIKKMEASPIINHSKASSSKGSGIQNNEDAIKTTTQSRQASKHNIDSYQLIIKGTILSKQFDNVSRALEEDLLNVSDAKFLCPPKAKCKQFKELSAPDSVEASYEPHCFDC